MLHNTTDAYDSHFENVHAVSKSKAIELIQKKYPRAKSFKALIINT